MKQVRSVRLEEVAALAGVSPATVSRFVNKPERVASATRERISAAVEATGYRPNLMAGALAGNRSRLIAVLVPEIAQSLFNDTVEAMIKELSIQGNNVVLALTGADNARLTAEIEIALARQVDAIILTGILSDSDVRKRLESSSVSVIETWGLPENPIDVAVGFSHREVGKEIARFTRSRGYRRPHLIVPMSPRAERRARRRP